MVLPDGLEPPTSALQVRRTTNCAKGASAVFPSCQCGCVPIVVRLGNCRDLAVSAIWLHQATCLTYTLLSPTHERETLFVDMLLATLCKLF